MKGNWVVAWKPLQEREYSSHPDTYILETRTAFPRGAAETWQKVQRESKPLNQTKVMFYHQNPFLVFTVM